MKVWRTRSGKSGEPRTGRRPPRKGLRLAGASALWILVPWVLAGPATDRPLPSSADFLDAQHLPGPERRGQAGILFRVRPAQGDAVGFLLATIHSGDPRVAALPEPVRRAFEESPSLALELLPDGETVIKSMLAMTYTDGRTLRAVLPADLYDRATEALAGLGMPPGAYRDFKPWAVVTLLSAPPAAEDALLDLRLYRSAVAAGKRLKGLETVEEQVAVLDGLSEADQIALLRDTLADRERLPALFESLVTAYLARDLTTIAAESEHVLAGAEPELAARFRERLIRARNFRLAERMAPLFDEGGWLIAVGAVHLPGEDGILRLLAHRGLRVTPVY